MSFKQNLLIAIAGVAISCSSIAAASAGAWQDNHPRRVQVNGRLDNQYGRINRDYRDGNISGAQAAALHSEDHALRTEECTDARFDRGHISGAEQRALNHQENNVSRQIYNRAR
jgi:hypothetical protein